MPDDLPDDAAYDRSAADLRHIMAAASSSAAAGRVLQEARRTDNLLHDLIGDACTNAFLAQNVG